MGCTDSTAVSMAICIFSSASSTLSLHGQWGRLGWTDKIVWSQMEDRLKSQQSDGECTAATLAISATEGAMSCTEETNSCRGYTMATYMIMREPMLGASWQHLMP